MLNSRVWRRLLGLSGVKIVDVDLIAEELVVRVALHRPQVQRCGACRRHCPPEYTKGNQRVVVRTSRVCRYRRGPTPRYTAGLVYAARTERLTQGSGMGVASDLFRPTSTGPGAGEALPATSPVLGCRSFSSASG